MPGPHAPSPDAQSRAMLYGWYELDGALFPATAAVLPPEGAQLLGYSVFYSLEDELLAASIAGLQAHSEATCSDS